MILLKCVKEILTDGDGVRCIQRNKGDGNTRMKNLKEKETLSNAGTLTSRDTPIKGLYYVDVMQFFKNKKIKKKVG